MKGQKYFVTFLEEIIPFLGASPTKSNTNATNGAINFISCFARETSTTARQLNSNCVNCYVLVELERTRPRCSSKLHIRYNLSRLTQKTHPMMILVVYNASRGQDAFIEENYAVLHAGDFQNFFRFMNVRSSSSDML